MDDDEFMKELNEAAEYLEQANKQNTSNNNNINQANNQQQIPTGNNSNNANPFSMPNFNENDLNDNLNKLLGMFGNISTEDMGFNDNDKESFKKFHESFMNELKDENLLKGFQGNLNKNDNTDSKNNANTNSNFSNLNNNNTNANSTENPYIDTFNQMNSEFGPDFDPSQFGDEFKKIMESLSKLGDISEKEVKEGGANDDGMSQFEGVLDLLISTNLLEKPLTEIKDEIIKFKNEKKDLSEEKKVNYDNMITSINQVLEELKKSNPDKTKMVELFAKLQDTSEMDEELYSKFSNDMNFLGELSGKHKENKAPAQSIEKQEDKKEEILIGEKKISNTEENKVEVKLEEKKKEE